MNKKINLVFLLLVSTSNPTLAMGPTSDSTVKNYIKNLANGLFSVDGVVLLASFLNVYNSILTMKYVMEEKSPVEKTFPRTTFKDYAGEIPKEISEIANRIKVDRTPHQFSQVGFLLYGLPGTGKTMLAECVAGELGCPFYSIVTSNLNNSSTGGGEAQIRGLFNEARNVAADTPGCAVILLDEIDAVCQRRDNGNKNMRQNPILASLLGEIDHKSPLEISIQKVIDKKPREGFLSIYSTVNQLDHPSRIKVLIDFCKKILSYIPIINRFITKKEDLKGTLIIIGATNCKKNIDAAVIRRGRLGTHVKIKEPDETNRCAIIKKAFESIYGNSNFNSSEKYLVNLSHKIARLTSGWTPADIVHSFSKNTITLSTPFEPSQLVNAVLNNEKMRLKPYASDNEKVDIIDSYKKNHNFTYINNEYLDTFFKKTSKWPKRQIKNIFKTALSKAGGNLVKNDDLNHSYDMTLAKVNELYKKNLRIRLNVLINLYPCNTEFTERAALDIAIEKKIDIDEMPNIFEKIYKKNDKTITLDKFSKYVDHLEKSPD